MTEQIKKGIECEKVILKAMCDEKVANFNEVDNRFLGYLDALYNCGFINDVQEIADEATLFRGLFE